MSTHILATAERYCDRFIILDQGEIVAMGIWMRYVNKQRCHMRR